jgi:hypothetical protein
VGVIIVRGMGGAEEAAADAVDLLWGNSDSRSAERGTWTQTQAPSSVYLASNLEYLLIILLLYNNQR